MFPRRVAIGPSVLIAIAISAVHLAAVAVLWLVPVPVVGKAVFTIVVAISLIFFMARDAALHAARSIVTLDLRESGEMACQTRSGDWVECELLGSTFVSPQLTVVHVRPRGWWLTRRVILVPDNVDPGDFRQLRTWLRWKGTGDGRLHNVDVQR